MIFVTLRKIDFLIIYPNYKKNMVKMYKSVKSSKKVAHTQYDMRFTQANRINNKNENCCKCGKEVIATQIGKSVTVTCGTFSFSGNIEKCITYVDVLSDFNDKHP